MSKARELSKLVNDAVFSVNDSFNVGVNSTAPTVKLDVVGTLNATSFSGDGSGLTNVGMDTSIANADQLQVTGVSTFSGDLNLGGSANVRLGDTNTLFVGAGNDLRILHSGGDSIINHAGTDGEFALLTTNEIRITNTGFAKTAAVFSPTGASELYHNNSKKLETTTDGVTITGNVSVGGTLTYEDVTNVDSIGVITARSGIRVGAGQSIGSDGALTYYGDGSQLSGISVGLGTEALTPSNSVVVLDLSKQDHKITATGICTITVKGGTEADSHTIRVINSGIATVGFSSYFLFPSGSTPVMPETSGAISLISFTVNKVGNVGAASTELLAGASLNYS